MCKRLFLLFSILFSFHFAEVSVLKEFSAIVPADSTKTLEKTSVPTEEKAFKIFEGGSVAIILAASIAAILASASNDKSSESSPEFQLFIIFIGILGVGTLALISKLLARERASKKESNNKKREMLAQRFFARQLTLSILAAAILLWSNIVIIIPIVLFGAIYGLVGYIGTQINSIVSKNKP